MAGAKRIVSLRRIAALYGAVEAMRALDLQQASGALTEAEMAIAVEHRAAVAANDAARSALRSGDREEWMLSEAQREIAGLREGRLEEMRAARTIVRDKLRGEYLESRMQTEQMKHMVAYRREQAEVEEARRAQATSDDRYLGRLRWLDARD